MTRITIDEDLRNKLHQLREPLELCDGEGQILGTVFPAVDLSQYEPWEPPISEEELQQREQSEEWHSTEDVLAYLKQLEKP